VDIGVLGHQHDADRRVSARLVFRFRVAHMFESVSARPNSVKGIDIQTWYVTCGPEWFVVRPSGGSLFYSLFGNAVTNFRLKAGLRTLYQRLSPWGIVFNLRINGN
jgi:hypothetical protein